MAETTFKTAITDTEQPQEPNIEAKSSSVDVSSDVEVPFLDYRATHQKPFSADYFQLGDRWDVFENEVSTIEGYFKGKIESGEIANDQNIIKSELKKLEKLTNVKDEPRAVVKIETLAAYIDFLNRSSKARTNFGRYHA